MRLFSKRQTDGSERRPGIVEELELLAKRARFLVFAVPVLVLLGIGFGKLMNGVLRVSREHATTSAEATRIELLAVSQQMERLRKAGDHTAEYVRMYQHEVAPIEEVLRRRGIPDETARKVAWPLVEQSYRNGVDPAMVVSVVLVESAGRPTARSPVGARGLMQVMPAWSGHWRGCGRDLYAIEDNLCYGTKILAMYLNRHRGDERRALLGYNGCVNGTNTPNCGLYPDKVASVRKQISYELASFRRKTTGIASTEALSQ